jgi:hypothetical protein
MLNSTTARVFLLESSAEIIKNDRRVYRKSGQTRGQVAGQLVSRIPEDIILALKGNTIK